MAARPEATSGWVTYEVFQRDKQGRHTITPFSEILSASGSMPRQAITKMRMVQDLGWPESKRVLKDDHGHHRIVKKTDFIWLLKCKPNCWRLYFHVWEKEKRIIYVHAVCKKSDKEDPSECAEA